MATANIGMNGFMVALNYGRPVKYEQTTLLLYCGIGVNMEKEIMNNEIKVWFEHLTEEEQDKYAKDFFDKKSKGLTNMEVSIIYRLKSANIKSVGGGNCEPYLSYFQNGTFNKLSLYRE